MGNNKIIYFLSHPIQYISPLLRELATKTDLTVYYYSDASVKGNRDKDFGVPVKWDTDLLSGYRHQFIRNFSRRKLLNNGFLDVFNPGVVKILRAERNAVVVVNGWSYSSDVLIILVSRLLGRKVWLRAENPLNQELKKSRVTLFLKKIVLKRLLFKHGISKCLFIGTENRKFFEFYGVPPAKQIYTPYAVDNHYFSAMAQNLKDKTDEIKKRLNLSLNRKIILFAGKYIPKKNPMDLLGAFYRLKEQNYILIMVGEGRLRGDMERFIERHELSDVYLTGFINQSEISDYYAIADVFVMCSGMGETWGLSVNEAMNFGKPIIVSDTCGCSSDLVRNGRNGFIFPEGNISLLAEYIDKLLKDDILRNAAGICSSKYIQAYSLEKIVNNLCENLED